MDQNAQYAMLRDEVIKRGADPSNIQAEIDRLVARIQAEIERRDKG